MGWEKKLVGKVEKAENLGSDLKSDFKQGKSDIKGVYNFGKEAKKAIGDDYGEGKQAYNNLKEGFEAGVHGPGNFDERFGAMNRDWEKNHNFKLGRHSMNLLQKTDFSKAHEGLDRYRKMTGKYRNRYGSGFNSSSSFLTPPHMYNDSQASISGTGGIH